MIVLLLALTALVSGTRTSGIRIAAVEIRGIRPSGAA